MRKYVYANGKNLAMMTKAASYGPFANACEDASAYGTGGDSSPLTVSLSPDCKKGSYSLQIAVGNPSGQGCNNGNFWFTSSTMQFTSGTYRYVHLWVKPSRWDSWLTFHLWDVDHGGWKTLKGDKNGDMWFRTGEDMVVNQWNELWLDLNKNDHGWVNTKVTSFSVHAGNNSTFLFDDVYCSPGAYNTYQYFCDYLGSPRVMTNNSGQVTWKQDYYAFGSDYNGTATGNTHKFTGHMQDAATGQYYAKARYFTTQLGRWSQPEPLLKGVPKGKFLANPQLLNPYVYCSNRPVVVIDPNGMDGLVVVTNNVSSTHEHWRGNYNMYQTKVYANTPIWLAKVENFLGIGGKKFELSRDAWAWKNPDWHDHTHSSKKYGTNNEAPPGEYFLSNSQSVKGSKEGWLSISDQKGGSTINGPDGVREGISIHSMNPHWSEGCSTTGDDEKDFKKLNDIKSAIGNDLNDPKQDVKIIFEAR